MQLNPYLHFGGRAAEAIEFYGRALGAKASMVMRYGDSPNPCADALKPLIMHARLEIAGNVLMLSDASEEPPTVGDGVSLSIGLVNEIDRGGQIFAALSEGGMVIMPYAKAFWGAHFGMLRDRFGFTWMVNCEEASGA